MESTPALVTTSCNFLEEDTTASYNGIRHFFYT